MAILSFTFDDGNLSQIRDFCPVLRKYAFPATFYVVASDIGLPGRLSIDNLHALVDDGNEIGSHGWTHKSLLGFRTIELDNELERSRDLLKRFGTKAFAYPYGHYDSRVAPEVARYYDSARAYSLEVVPNRADSLQRYALHSFSVEGKFRSRIDIQAPQYFLSRKDTIDSNCWFILTFHGRTSIRFASKAILDRANLTREQGRAYINDIRARLSSTRCHIVRDFEKLCAHLAHERITVVTVSRGLQELT